MTNLDFIYKRKSVRKFTDEVISNEAIKTLIQAATQAPSGKNLQNWHFIVIKDKQKINQIAKIVEKKNDALASYLDNEDEKKKLTKFLKYHTIFKNAPVLILVYAGSYIPAGYKALQAKGASREEIDNLLKPSPGVQNIAAAMENLQLASAQMGYGTCWMTGPLYAKEEITEYIGFEKDGYFLAAMTPIGVPVDEDIKSPPRKPVEDVLTIIE
ncbi:nitroreductase family protein [Clostridium sp. D2Q-11]|uniref:Nitroreductase family protein n=1 Tax=Anaeromonas frigoriresistens TaxID=2683708 RepID=A0A942UR12_9FIRM|nr:nitroreductase family protein [Anaeromonas frigoriresistens]MBS4537618.1 nitroreductase family protein [Anaeromonas frigoriresistens]